MKRYLKNDTFLRVLGEVEQGLLFGMVIAFCHIIVLSTLVFTCNKSNRSRFSQVGYKAEQTRS